MMGKKKQPIFRIVVSETRYKRDGRPAAILGTYNPNITPPKLSLDKEAFEKWVKRGAIISDGLRKILPASPKRGEPEKNI